MSASVAWLVRIGAVIAAFAVCSVSAKDARGAGPAPADLGAIWAGGYTYTYEGGRTAGGSPITVAYRLGIAADPKGKACRLDIQGFQSNQTLLCRLGGSDTDVTVRFESYGDGSTLNAYGVKQYEVGEGLLTLRRAGDGRILTEWLKITPDDSDRFDAPGVFFAHTR